MSTNNMRITVENGDLVIRSKLDPRNAADSKGGKTELLATSGGFVEVIQAEIPGLKVNFNLTQPLGSRAKAASTKKA